MYIRSLVRLAFSPFPLYLFVHGGGFKNLMDQVFENGIGR